MKDLTTRQAAYILASSDLETEQERFLRVLHCVQDGCLPDSGDLADAIMLHDAINNAGAPRASRGLAQLSILWRALLPTALAHYYSLEVAA